MWPRNKAVRYAISQVAFSRARMGLAVLRKNLLRGPVWLRAASFFALSKFVAVGASTSRCCGRAEQAGADPRPMVQRGSMIVALMRALEPRGQGVRT